MVQRIKTDLCSLVRELGYNITDNGAYVENFPWLMARTNGYKREDMLDTRTDIINITIDIFSIYKGEKEILDIVKNISDNINKMRITNKDITFIQQKNLRILDDNQTGPVKKHGVLTYQFTLTSSRQEEQTDDTTGN